MTILGILKQPSYSSLISSLNQFPRLQELRIEHEQGSDLAANITVPLVNGTSRGILTRLHLENVTVKVGAFEKILLNNPQLEFLNIRTMNVYDDDGDGDDDRSEDCYSEDRCRATQACLARTMPHYNWRLTMVYTVSRTRDNVYQELNTIDYYTAVNQWGRKDLTLAIGKREFLDRLNTVSTWLSPGFSASRSLGRFGGDPEQVLLYELLRSVPHLWCSTSDERME